MLFSEALKYWRQGSEKFKEFLSWTMTEDIYKLYYKITDKLDYGKFISNRDELKAMKEVVERKFHEWNCDSLLKLKEKLEEALQITNEGIEQGHIGEEKRHRLEKLCLSSLEIPLKYNSSIYKNK